MNYHGYFKKYGNKNFIDYPFNDFDVAVLTIMSYIKWESFIPNFDVEDSAPYAFSNIEEKAMSNLCKETLDPKHHTKIAKKIISLDRYKDIKIKYIINKVDFDKKYTFFACTFEIPNFHDVVCFRGTDITILAWEENLSQSLDIVTPSQSNSLEYLNKVSNLIDGDFYVCGHSKGGNLALYAAMNTQKEIQDRIKRVVSLDGTGFYRDDYYENESYLRIKDRVIQIIPKDSYVGIIFYAPSHFKVVGSRYIGVLQHLPYSWKLNKDGSCKFRKHRSYMSVVRQRALRIWVDNATKETKALTVDAIVTVMGGEDKDVGFYLRHPLQIANSVEKWKNKYTKEQKKEIFKFSRQLVNAYFASFFYLIPKKHRIEFKKQYYK